MGVVAGLPGTHMLGSSRRLFRLSPNIFQESQSPKFGVGTTLFYVFAHILSAAYVILLALHREDASHTAAWLRALATLLGLGEVLMNLVGWITQTWYREPTTLFFGTLWIGGAGGGQVVASLVAANIVGPGSFKRTIDFFVDCANDVGEGIKRLTPDGANVAARLGLGGAGAGNAAVEVE
ncbi:hypothetical protein RQP46_009798 [Phenoliferia psychrophenolica]